MSLSVHDVAAAGGDIQSAALVNDIDLALECKASPRVRPEHLKGLREFAKEHPAVGRRVVVSLVETARTTEDGIEILPVGEFCQRLWAGELC